MSDSILWSFSLPGDLRVDPIIPCGKLICNNVAYLPGSDGILYALDIDTGKVLWTFNILCGASSAFAFDNGVLYLINGNAQLIAIDLDLSDGVNKWKNNLYLSE